MANEKSPLDTEGVGGSILEHNLKRDIEGLEGKVSTGDAADGTFTRVTPMTTSFLHRLATVDNDNYNNEIKTGYYQSNTEGRLFAAALYEAEFLGEDPRPILLLHMVGNARDRGGLVDAELDALGRSTYRVETARTKNGKKSPLS
jgi:hypothetical protein